MIQSGMRTIYAVSELADTLRALVEDSLPRVWVEGEISNLSRPASGHWYFTIKDSKAQMRCAMFRGANRLVAPTPANGDRVVLRASVSFYTARGDLQLICEHMEPAGEGALLRAFEELKKRLSAEGLFDEAHKRALPPMPRRIGLITSATGAAIQDVTAALARRFPLAKAFLWPVAVQGETAAPAIVKALKNLPRHVPVDLILLVRGGGSLEDLRAFNEETVARAIRACAVPVICGVGHEIDTTIADYAADLRAPTPTAAAELASPDQDQIRRQLDALGAELAEAMDESLESRRDALTRLVARLQLLHPRRVIQDGAQGLDDASTRMTLAMQRRLHSHAAELRALSARASAQHPLNHLKFLRQQLENLSSRAAQAQNKLMQDCRHQLAHTQAVLNSLSPTDVLKRGYALARLADGTVLRDPSAVSENRDFELLLARGSLRARKIG